MGNVQLGLRRRLYGHHRLGLEPGNVPQILQAYHIKLTGYGMGTAFQTLLPFLLQLYLYFNKWVGGGEGG